LRNPPKNGGRDRTDPSVVSVNAPAIADMYEIIGADKTQLSAMPLA
jgi:hypothetical protein